MNLRSKLSGLICVLLLFFITNTYGQNTDFYLKNNDRIVFFGDSITEQAFYTNFVETYVVTRFPKLNVTFVNSGWSGDWVVGGGGGKVDERLSRDVFPYKPTVLTAMFGMNDGCYVEFNADCFKVYSEGYERLLSLLKKDAPELRITLLQPSPFDDLTNSSEWRLPPPIKGGYNNIMIRYGEFVKELASKNNLNTANMNAALIDVMQKAQISDADLAQKIIPDRIHPGAAGGLLMAEALLKTWNAPSVVSAVEIDGKARKVIRSENTKASDLKIDKTISWTQLDSALPLPLDTGDKTLALVLKLSDVNESLNRQMLKVNNLEAKQYELKINSEKIGVFTRDELSKGINLAALPTPMLRQALAVHKLTEQHNKVHYTRWREVQVPLEKENAAAAQKAIKDLDDLEMELIKKQRSAAMPRAYAYELVPQN